MKKLTRLLCCALTLAFLGGCSPSPTAITVNGRAVDAAELAFYMEYNRLNLQEQSGEKEKSEEALLKEAKKEALEQITTAEIVLEQCDKRDLKLSKEEKADLKENKQSLIESQGGKAGYLKYLRASAMADRVYDKFQRSTLYYDKLYDHLVGPGGKYDFTEVELRQFFADHYATVQYIQIAFPPDGAGGQQQVLQRAETIFAQSQVPGADFTHLIEIYNDDLYMRANPQGIVMTSSQCQDSPQFNKVFDMKEGEIDGVFLGDDGYYILKRLPLSALYFDENQEAILQEARDHKFNELLSGWKKDAKVHTTGIFKKMDFKNLWDYVE